MTTRFLLALGAIAAAGCTDPVIDMSLTMPTASQMPANFDLSCVSAIEVTAYGHQQPTQTTPGDQHLECVDLPRAPTSFADIRNAIAGKFDLKLPPSGLAGIEIRGTRGACGDVSRFYEAHFFGGVTYLDGQDTLSVPVLPNISCNAHHTYNVSTIDLMALTQSRTCALAIPTGQTPLIFAGNIRPLMLSTPFPKMVFEDGPSAVTPDLLGKAPIDSWSAVNGTRSCIAMGYDSGVGYAGSCINPGAPTLCAGPNELELPVIDSVFAASSVDSALNKAYGEPVFGAVYKASAAATITKVPLAGATVELDDPSQGKVVYVTRTQQKLVPIDGATATGPDGLFMVYVKSETATITVKSASGQQRYTVATPWDLPATLLAVLP